MGGLPVSIDVSKCIGCGDCLTACMFGALQLENGVAQVNENCRGCSQCVNVCRTAAISGDDLEKVHLYNLYKCTIMNNSWRMTERAVDGGRPPCP